MKTIRIIPCLDIKGGRVVKGVNFENLRDARDPIEAAAAYCREGADELVFLDIFATVEDRKTRLDWVKGVRDVVTIPFAVGGGIGSVDDMKALLSMGVDKVSINTAAVENPKLIEAAAKEFGRDKFVTFCQDLRDKKDFQRAMSSNYPFSNIQELEEGWKKYLRK